MIISSLYCVGYFGYLFAYWSCMPEKTEMPPPDAPDTPELYKHETIAQFTRAQWYEWDHLVRSPIGWIPNFPNSKAAFFLYIWRKKKLKNFERKSSEILSKNVKV